MMHEAHVDTEICVHRSWQRRRREGHEQRDDRNAARRLSHEVRSARPTYSLMNVSAFTILYSTIGTKNTKV